MRRHLRQRTGIGRRTWRQPPRSVGGLPGKPKNHRSNVDVRAVGADGSVATVSRTLGGPQLSLKIVQINGRRFDLRAQGINLIIHYVDRPGALGNVAGTAG